MLTRKLPIDLFLSLRHDYMMVINNCILKYIVCWYYRTLPQHEEAATFSRHTEKLSSSDTRQSTKCRIVTEGLSEMYSQMRHIVASGYIFRLTLQLISEVVYIRVLLYISVRLISETSVGRKRLLSMSKECYSFFVLVS